MTTATDETRRVLELLSHGKITVDDADQLLRALKDTPPATEAQPTQPRWMRISIDKAAHDGHPARNVNIRVPLALARSGVRLGAMFPFVFGPKLKEEFRKQGVDVDFSKIDLSDIEAAAKDLGETTIDVDDGKAQIRIRCE
jgi:SHOCT-like protein